MILTLTIFKTILAPYKAPDLAAAVSSNSTSLMIKWNNLVKDQFQGQPIGYHITYYPDGIENDLNFLSVNHTKNSSVLSNLIAYTIYVINVSAVSSGGIGPAKTVKFRTEAEGMETFFVVNDQLEICGHSCKYEFVRTSITPPIESQGV